MRLKYDVYLAGAMNGRVGAEVLCERQSAKTICKALGLSYYDPAESEDLSPVHIINTKMSHKQMRHFVQKDFRNLDKCRTVVALTGDHSSAGTLWELARMKFKWNRPIVLVAPLMVNGQLTNFSTILASKICETQKDALRWIKRGIK